MVEVDGFADFCLTTLGDADHAWDYAISTLAQLHMDPTLKTRESGESEVAGATAVVHEVHPPFTSIGTGITSLQHFAK